MGTWGAEIFDDDLALDVQAEYEQALEEENDVVAATEAVIEAFSDSLEDEDEQPIIVLTLAYLQAKDGNLLDEIKKRALEIIDTGEGLDRWEEEGGTALKKRKQALQELKLLILNG